jgi:peptidoglycan hydrolase-like protein with peptidoglycan-binding domain
MAGTPDIRLAVRKCTEASNCLKSARAMKSSRALVIRATELYREVIETWGTRLPDPFLGLAYIAWASGNKEAAMTFLRTCRQVAPADPRAAEMLRQIKAGATLPNPVAPPPKRGTGTLTLPPEETGPPPTRLSNDMGVAGSGKKEQGLEVGLLQRALKRLGYAVQEINTYDKTTYTAIRTLQSSRKLPVTGIADQAIRDILNPVLHTLEAEANTFQQLMATAILYRETREQPLGELHKQLTHDLLLELLATVQIPPTEAELQAAAPGGLSEPESRDMIVSRLGNMGQQGIVSKGLEVQRAQEILFAQGYEVRVNGTFDLQTFTALNRFQMDHGLPVSGRVEGETRDLINTLLTERYNEEVARETLEQELLSFQQELSLPRTHAIEKRVQGMLTALIELLKSDANGPLNDAGRELLKIKQDGLGPPNRPGVKVSDGPDVRRLQQALQQAGHKIEVNSRFDQATYAAVRAFQISAKLPMTGIVDARTQEALNQIIVQQAEG